MNDLLTGMLQQLDEPAARLDMLDRYYLGQQPLAFLAPEARDALGDRLTTLSINIPRLLVDSIAERLRVVGFDRDDVWPAWIAADLDQLAPLAHREALTMGTSYAVVWAHPDGSPNVSIESPRQVTVLRDPSTRRIVAAVKRWRTDTTTEAVLYEGDRITRFTADSVGASTVGFRSTEVLDNPLGVVPVVEFRNATRLLQAGRSEMADVLSLSDALTKLTADMLVASEYTARPRRWATGLELEEDDDGNEVSPISEGDRMMINQEPDGKFGQLPGSDLAGYETAIGTIMRQISAVSGLPEHMLGIGGDNPTSADSIRASEAALTARAEARQHSFGRSWEQVARLMIAVAGGLDPHAVDVRVKWANPATRSMAQEADAVTKLYTAGLLPASTALARLGYTADEVEEIRAVRRAESLDSAGVDVLRGLAS